MLRTSIMRTDHAEHSRLAMTYFRTPLSAAIAWVMIPLAAWAGMPSRACVCANGHVKLFCAHTSRAVTPHEDEHAAACGHCCGSANAAEADAEHDADCCGSGFCCHGAKPGMAGIGAKACCKPILTAPSAAPKVVSVNCDQAPAVVAVAYVVGARVHSSFRMDVAEFDTGPPLDRIIVFRSLLI